MATAVRQSAPPVVRDTRFFGHPRGLSTLFFTEMWERFSYYGMRALLILFMTAPVAAGGLGFDTAKAGADLRPVRLAGVLSPLVPGGWLADRVLGQRRTVFVRRRHHHAGAHLPGGPFAHDLLLWAWPWSPPGPGCSSPNVSMLVGKLYTPEDVRRDAGFSIYYMGINTGALIAPLVSGWFAQSEQFRGILASAGIAPESAWHWGFAMAAIGMFFGLVQFLAGWKHLGDAGMYPAAGGVAGAGGLPAPAPAAGTDPGARRRADALAALLRRHRANHRRGREQRSRPYSAGDHGSILRLDVLRRPSGRPRSASGW